MSESIIVALITVGGTIIGNILLNRKAAADQEIKRAVSQQKLDDQLLSIGKRLDEHNNYAQKFGEISDCVSDIKLNIVSMQKDIEYLRKGTDI